MLRREILAWFFGEGAGVAIRFFCSGSKIGLAFLFYEEYLHLRCLSSQIRRI
jgi:hypothetical protein